MGRRPRAKADTGRSCNCGRLFDGFSGTPTLAQLEQYDIVVAFSNNAYNDAVAMGNVLADYADAGGIVVGLAFDWSGSPLGLDGRWITGGYHAVR